MSSLGNAGFITGSSFWGATAGVTEVFCALSMDNWGSSLVEDTSSDFTTFDVWTMECFLFSRLAILSNSSIVAVTLYRIAKSVDKSKKSSCFFHSFSAFSE